MFASLSAMGWFVWLLLVVGLAMLGGSVAIIADALRRPRTHFSRLGRWPWTTVQAAFLGVVVGARLFGGGLPVVRVALVLTPVAFVQQIAYLLRVVFPTPERREARELAGGPTQDRAVT